MGNVARMWKRRGAYRVFLGKAEVKRPLARYRRGWVNPCTYKWVVKNKMGGLNRFIWLRIGAGDGLL